MTDSELTIWEHLDSVIRVLTSKEMGVWLYRRDKRILVTELEKIKAEVCEPNEMEYFENSNVWQKWFCDLIDKHIAELKGKQE